MRSYTVNSVSFQEIYFCLDFPTHTCCNNLQSSVGVYEMAEKIT